MFALILNYYFVWIEWFWWFGIWIAVLGGLFLECVFRFTVWNFGFRGVEFRGFSGCGIWWFSCFRDNFVTDRG